VREAREETSLAVVGGVRWVWKRERVMQWRERKVLHRERFFLGRADPPPGAREVRRTLQVSIAGGEHQRIVLHSSLP